MLVDTHAGAGLYNLQERFATTSQESEEGIVKLFKSSDSAHLTEGIREYLKVISKLQAQKNHLVTYPGSPYLLWQSMRALDKLRLMELHPSDFPDLKNHLSQVIG